MRPPGAKRGAAPFGSAESHELRSWARLRRAGCAPAPCLPPPLSPHTAFAPSPPAPTQTPALTKPLSPPPPQTQKTSPKSQNTRLSPAPPRPLRGRQTGRSPIRLRRKPRASLVGPPAAGGLRPCPLPSPNAFPSRCFFSLSCPPATSPNAPNQKTPPQPFTDYGGAFICGISSRH